MAPLQGRTCTVSIQTAAGPPAVFTLIGEGTTVDKAGTRDSTQTAVFGTATKRSAIGVKASTVTFNVLAEVADAGQVALNAGYDAGTAVILQVRPDGSKGFTANYFVTSRRYSAAAENGFQTLAFELTQDGDETIEAGGGVIY